MTASESGQMTKPHHWTMVYLACTLTHNRGSNQHSFPQSSQRERCMKPRDHCIQRSSRASVTNRWGRLLAWLHLVAGELSVILAECMRWRIGDILHMSLAPIIGCYCHLGPDLLKCPWEGFLYAAHHLRWCNIPGLSVGAWCGHLPFSFHGIWYYPEDLVSVNHMRARTHTKTRKHIYTLIFTCALTSGRTVSAPLGITIVRK